ncbi:AvrD family protein [Streptomyces hundungensis]|uniref:AvrD family protein n=1 Tax=Streptomyces hundungensis TaxID=1077946 RepID=UPI0033F45FA5
MTATAVLPHVLSLASADEFLGDRKNRFFGEGFKRVTHVLTDITVRPTALGIPGRIDATAGVRIPGTWSRKGESHQRPHLSTIDAMAFAAQLTGLYLAHTRGLGRQDSFVVRSLSIKAGSAPDEDGLDRFPAHAQHIATGPADRPGHQLTVTDCRIGSLTVRVEAEHTDSAVQVGSDGTYGVPEFLPGPWNDAPFGASHHGRHQLLRDIRADGVAHTASARLDITTDIEGTRPAAQPPTMIDLFTACLQLGQILLYRLDGVDRATSNTLWMRRTTISPVPAHAADDGRLRVELAKPTELPTEDGVWRAAKITAGYAGMALTCHVAHRLPALAAPAS